MALIEYRLGDLIEPCNNRNSNGTYPVGAVRGISTGKEFITTKANMDGVSLAAYKIVRPQEFAYVADTSRRGDKISLAFNTTGKELLVSPISTVFRVKSEALLAEYLFLYFNRPEFDRFARFNSWGSARETFGWNDFCGIEIRLPSVSVQKKYAAVYQAAVTNQHSYEQGLAELKLSFEALLDRYKHSAPKRTVGAILREVDCRNTGSTLANVQGINIAKQFMPSVANTYEVDLSRYKVVKKGQFAFSGMQTGRDECIRIARFEQDEPVIISPAYMVLEPKDPTVLPEYVMMWFSRKEVDRQGWFMSDASIRTNLDVDRFYGMEIPVPSVEIQQDIVSIFKAYNARKEIAEKLKVQMQNLCPILIKGSIEEAMKPNEV